MSSLYRLFGRRHRERRTPPSVDAAAHRLDDAAALEDTAERVEHLVAHYRTQIERCEDGLQAWRRRREAGERVDEMEARVLIARKKELQGLYQRTAFMSDAICKKQFEEEQRLRKSLTMDALKTALQFRTQSLDIGELERIQERNDERTFHQREIDERFALDHDISSEQLREEYRQLSGSLRPAADTGRSPATRPGYGRTSSLKRI
eukprot:Selendium_serpulae@DN4107_c0_g1_i1.p1